MVQRKVANKLLIGIQADDGVNNKSDKHRPPSPHHQQDGKNRGADLKKKKMKKSRSFKRCSDFESLRPSPTFRREIPQLGKPPPPPPPDVPAQKQSVAIKGSLDGSPNYMKSTSSFDARREQQQQQQQQQRTHHQVSSQKSQTPNKSPKKITPNSSSSSSSSSSKLSSVSSGHKLSKTLSRTSSLKLVRTLIKTPSFKPARASTRKCSQAVLCENLQVERSTCSSTLKDSKFPNYLDLSPGATESQGTSVMKVCPYTYCSLNGHHHAPLPPLKCFLSARRHMLKTQKRMKKLGCLSPRPRRARPSSDTLGGTKEITEHMTLDVKPSIQEELDSNSPTIHPLIQEDDEMDYFIEIYARDTEDAAETTGGRSKQKGENKDETNETAAEHDGGGQVERLSDEAPLHSEIDFEDNLYNTSEFISTGMEAAEEVRSPFSTQEEEESPEYLTNQSDFKMESPASTELDETESETCDMEWEEGQYSAPSLNDEVANSTQTNNEYHFDGDSSFGANNSSLHDEPIFKSDEIVSRYFDDISGDEGPKEFFEEEGASSGGGCGSSGSVSEGSYQHLGADKSMQEFNNQNYLVSSTYDVFKESTTEERDGNAEFYETAITLSPIEEPIEKPSALLANQECDSCRDFTEPRHDETNEDYSSSDKNTEVYQSNAVREEAFVGSLLPKTEDPEMNQSLEKALPTADAGDPTEEQNEEEEQEGAAKSLIRIPTSEMLLQGLSEDHQDMTQQDDNEIQFGVIAKDGEANQSIVDEGLPAETVLHSSVRESQTNNNVEDQNHPDHEAQSFKISDSIDSEDQTHWELNKVSVAKNSSEDDNEMEVEHSTMSDPKESFPSSKKAASKQAKVAFFHGRNHSSQKLPKDPNNNLRIIRCKRPVEESEEARKFNPREPNYLPIEADPEAEKVDLRHQMVDEKKNSEEWMLDYALRQAVTKLAPARKRKVSLLVEAFEKVMPIPKYESHLKHTSAAFAHARSIQACS